MTPRPPPGCVAWIATRDPLSDTRAVTAQLAFVRSALDDGAGERMQHLFPEGYFFSHVLYGLAWTDVARRNPARAGDARREAARAVAALESAPEPRRSRPICGPGTGSSTPAGRCCCAPDRRDWRPVVARRLNGGASEWMRARWRPRSPRPAARYGWWLAGLWSALAAAAAWHARQGCRTARAAGYRN